MQFLSFDVELHQGDQFTGHADAAHKIVADSMHIRRGRNAMAVFDSFDLVRVKFDGGPVGQGFGGGDQVLVPVAGRESLL